MKVGDLVIDYTGDHTGIIVAVGNNGSYMSVNDSPSLWPDIHVMTDDGKMQRWNSKHVKVIDESR